METIINITNGLHVIAIVAIVLLVVLVRRGGSDERAQYMGYKLYSFLFTFMLVGLSLIILVTGWYPVEYTMLRVYITTLFSLNVFVGIIYWLYLKQKM